MRRITLLRRHLAIAGAGCVLVGLFAAGAGAADPVFVASTLAAGDGPHSIATTDLNGDRDADLAVANEGSDDVSIRLGDGAGGFGAPSSVPVGDGPLGLAVADLNRDGDPDIAVANVTSDDLSILLGDGDGGFEPAGPRIPLTNGPWYVSIGDLNSDRKLDLVIAHVGFGETGVPSTDVSILLGDGTGAFAHAPGSPITVGRVPYGVEIADFNRDRKPDLAIANQFDNFVSVLLGDGTGQFQPAPGSPIVVGPGPSWLVAADFDGDKNVDLAVAVSSGSIPILLGDGAGGFAHASGSPIAVASAPHNMRAADFDRDGELDLGVDTIENDSFSVFLGDGEGQFGLASTTPVGDGPLSMAVGDFNHDRKPDVVVGNHFDDTLSVLLNATVTRPKTR
jgi:FG-GAP-like repeat